MSTESTEPARTTDHMAGVEALESGAFRVGRLVRELRAECPGLWPLIDRINASVFASGSTRLELDVYDADAADQLAAHFGITLECSMHASAIGGAGGYVHTRGTATIDDVTVEVASVALIDAVEWSQLQAGEDPCHPCGCPKRFDRHADGCPAQTTPVSTLAQAHAGGDQ
ncbi:hypothetical protein AB0903_34240 [Streptomyces sp. NPDC048389]|uniref:hypothetical protein n=1 Tax=Streptomyces sp. NPDC048389 TaxID=3154622 RepID=UPI0034531592